MPDGIYATAAYCAICGDPITEGSQFDDHGWAGHGYDQPPTKEERIAKIQELKAAGIYPGLRQES